MSNLIDRIVILFDRFMPEPFAFGVLMTLFAMGLTLGVTDAGPMDVVVAWGDGLSSLLSFITQVCLTIMFAYALAHLPPGFSSVGLLLEPVAAALLAWIILAEAVTPWQAAGGAVILWGIVLARMGSR